MFASNTSQVSSDATYIEDVFSTYLYTGNGSTQTINNGIDLAGQGGLVWIKARNNARSHQISDTAQGVGWYLASNTTNPAYNDTNRLSAFNSDGYSLGEDLYNGDWNYSGTTYASWTFRKQPKFFDCGTFTAGSNPNRRISHALGAVPGFIIVKTTSTNGDWYCYHRSTGRSTLFQMNTTNAQYTGIADVWGTSDPTDTDFGLKESAFFTSGDSVVWYAFAHNAGGFGLTGTDNVISCGSYTGNGSTTGPVVTLGYEPQWILIKRASNIQNWFIVDNMRGMPVGSNDGILRPNDSGAETSQNFVFPTATGFQIETVDTECNASGNTYIYIAIRRGPMKVPTDGTKVFNTVTATGGPPVFTPGFVTDMAWTKVKNSAATGFRWVSRLLSGTYTDSSSTSGEAALAQYSFDYQNGWRNATVSDSTLLSWSFQRAPGFFDEVCYTGNGTTGRTVNHNLTVVPDFMIVKNRSNANDWYCWLSSFSASEGILLNTDGPKQTNRSWWNYTLPTSTYFTLEQYAGYNAAGNNYVAYLFASCPGVSKVGTYVGTEAQQDINCGFSSGARFVLVKAVDDGGAWYLADTARGITTGNDPTLRLNTTDPESNTRSWVDPLSQGFRITADAGTSYNKIGITYLYLAIA